MDYSKFIGNIVQRKGVEFAPIFPNGHRYGIVAEFNEGNEGNQQNTFKLIFEDESITDYIIACDQIEIVNVGILSLLNRIEKLTIQGLGS